MARIYDVVCLKCGEIMKWCKYDPPFNKCPLCGSKLAVRSGDWDEKKVQVFGVWSTSDDVDSLSIEKRTAFFGEGGYRFRLRDGRLCTVELKKCTMEPYEFPVFLLTLRTGGKKASLLCMSSELSEVVNMLRKYNTADQTYLMMVEYRGARFCPQHPMGKLILKAIRENLKPEITAILG